MIDVKNIKCKGINCEKIPNFNYVTLNKGI